MKFQFFGSRNVRTSEDLRSVGKPKLHNRVRKTDDWGLDAVSALRVPILSGRQQEVAKKTVLVVSDPIDTIPRINPRKHLRLIETDIQEQRKKVGIYSSKQTVRTELQKHLNDARYDLVMFDDASIQIDVAAMMDTWLIHMLDEDDSPLLDALLELDTTDSSLFLCERELSEQSIRKAKHFLSGCSA